MRDELYDKLFERIKDAYEDKILQKLYDIKGTCESSGLVCADPIDLCNDEFRWSLPIWLDKDHNTGATVDIVIEEQREHDGETDEEGNPTFGLNFSITITQTDGRILGGVSPFNYTPFVWVDARIEEVVEDRWFYIENLDNFPIPMLINEG